MQVNENSKRVEEENAYHEELKELLNLLKSPDPDVKKKSARKIAAFGDFFIPELFEMLRYGDESVVEGVVLALSEIGEDAVEPLIFALSDDEEKVRMAAVWSLGLILGEKAVEHLIKALSDRSQRVRTAAAITLANVEATEALVKALKSEDWKVSYGAGRAIIEAGSRIIPSLLEHLSKNESTEDRILEVLGEIKDEVSNSLFELIKDYDDKSIVAAEVISKLDNTAEYIHKALISGNRRVREAACVLLASMRRYDLLIDALEDDSWFVRFISAEALSEAEDEILKRAKDSLFRLLEDEKKIVRNSAAKTLRRLGK